jgi:hypothetical protein
MTMPHLDEESLSAAFDGEATPAERAHLASCADCQAALGSLAEVARAVGAAITPRPAEAIAAAIAQALRDSPLTAATAPRTPISITASPTVAASQRGTPAPRFDAIAPPGQHHRQPSGWILGVAGIAAAVALVAVLGLLGRSRSATTTTSPALSAGAAGASTTAPSTRSSGLVTDLGDQSDPGVVARLVLAAPRSLGAVAGSTAPGTTGATLAAPSANGLVPDSSLASTPCAAEARVAVAVAPERPVQYAASLRWRGQAAIVEVFASPNGLVGVIMKAAGCSALVVLPTP